MTLAGGLYKSLDNFKIMQQKTKRSLAFNVKRRNVDFLLYIALLSLGCMSSAHAKPLQVHLNYMNRESYVPTFPLETGSDVYETYNGEQSDVDYTNGGIEDAPEISSKPDVSTATIYNVSNTSFLLM